MRALKVGLQMLQIDPQPLDDRLRDEKFVRELYRGLAGNRLSKDGEVVAPSWKRAEELVNALRRGVVEPPLELDQTGGEDQLDDTVTEELEGLGWSVEQLDTGWSVEPLDTGRHDPSHASSRHNPRPPDHGERMARPVQDANWSGVAESKGRPRRARKRKS